MTAGRAAMANIAAPDLMKPVGESSACCLTAIHQDAKRALALRLSRVVGNWSGRAVVKLRYRAEGCENSRMPACRCLRAAAEPVA